MKKSKQNYLKKTFSLIKNNPKIFFYIVIIDILFLGVLNLFYKLTDFLILKDTTEISKIIVIFYLVITVLYYLLLVLIYSFFKYIILKKIKLLSGKIKTGFKKFYLLNLLIFVVFFAAILLLNPIILLSVKEQYRPYVFLIINLPLFLIAYIFMNISHTIYSESKKTIIKDIIKKTFGFMGKIKNYIGIFLADIIAIVAYFMIFYLIGSLLKITVFKATFGATAYTIYETIFVIITSIFLYLIIFFNRIYFYSIVKDKNVLP